MILSTLLLGTLTPVLQDAGQRGPQPVLPHFEDIKTPGTPAPPRAIPRPSQRDSHPVPLSANSSTEGRDLAGSPAALPGHIIDRVFVDRPTGTDWWARGRTYKARFGADGVDYIPFLGSTAPKNYPLGLRLVAAQVGEQFLEIDSSIGAEYADDTVSFERGQLSERYLLGLESVEQTFVFHEPTNEALRVEVRFETELEYGVSEDGISFSHALGRVHMSAAFAVDAAGNTISLNTEFGENSYSIVVPAGFVASATFPVTIDPVLSTMDVDDIGAPLTAPRAAYDPATDTFFTVYSENFSATDGDVYSTEICNGSGAGCVVLVGYADITADRWFTPDVGSARANGVMLVAAGVEESGSGLNSVLGRIYNPTTRTYDGVFRVDAAQNNSPKSQISVGGDPIDRFLVVWEREFSGTDRDVHARVVSSAGVPMGTSDIQLDNSVVDYSNPNCSKHNRSIDINLSAWSVVSQREVGGVQEIWAAQISWTGTIEEGFFSVSSVAGQDQLLPRVSSPLEEAGAPTYAVTWMNDFGSDVDIVVAAVQAASVLDLENLSVGDLPGSFLNDEFGPHIDSNGTGFCMAWRDGDIGDFDTTYVSSVNLEGGQFCVAESVVIDSIGFRFPQGLVAATLPANNPTYLIVSEDTLNAGTEDIHAVLYAADQACLGTIICTPAVTNSSGGAAQISASGSDIAGSVINLLATNLPTNQFGFFVVSRTAGGPVTPPGSQGNLCLNGILGRYNASILNSGLGGEFQLSVDTSFLPFPSNVAVQPGEFLNFTAWFRDNNPGSTSNFSDVVRIGFN